MVGGGLAGLTAAHDLAAAGLDVLLLEGSDRLGGKLHRHEVGGVIVDVGAEAMLNRRPEAVDLARALGLPVVHPTAARPQVWTHGALRRLPRTVMGVPLDLEDLAASGVLTQAGVDRARREDVTEVGADPTVGELVSGRLGREVVDRLVEPLLGGVYAGRADALSARATVPQLVAAAERGRLLDVVAPDSDVPVFAGIAGGVTGLVDALADGSFEVRTGRPVVDLASLDADAVVVATPAPAAARLLAERAPRAAAELATIGYASLAVITLAVRGPLPREASGFLVPPVDARRIKAATFSFAKWDWVSDASDVCLLRASVGRSGEEAALQVPDQQLVAAAVAEVADATGWHLEVVDSHVQRWGGGLPQYAVGHLERVARIRDDVARAGGLAMCGAAYDGVGLAAVVATGHRAASSLLARG